MKRKMARLRGYKLDIGRVSQLMAERGIEKTRLHELIGVDRATVTRWFNHTTAPDFGQLARLAELLGTSAEFLIGRSTKRELVERVRTEIGDEEAQLVQMVADKPQEQKQMAVAVVSAMLGHPQVTGARAASTKEKKTPPSDDDDD